MNKILTKPRDLEVVDWNDIIRIDAWSKRKILYKIEKFITREIRGLDILFSINWEEKIINTFGTYWKTFKIGKPHLARERSKFTKEILKRYIYW